MQEKGMVLLPVYNAEKTVETVVERILAGTHALDTEYDILAIDDGSKDGSYQVLKELAAQHSNLILDQHIENQGLAQVLKRGYRHSVDHSYGHTIRTDADSEQNQTEVVSKLGRKVADSDVVVARRQFRGEGLAETHLKIGMSAIMNEIFGLKILEPSSRNLAFQRRPLEDLIDTEFLKNYARRWSFDASSVILASKLGYNIGYVDVEGFSEPDRRPAEKVFVQYSTYFQTINELKVLEVKPRKL